MQFRLIRSLWTAAKLLAGTRHLFSGLSHPRQCGDDVLWMLVTGGQPVSSGDGMPQHLGPSLRLRITGGIVREDAGYWREVADVAVDHAEQGDDRGLVGGDAVENTGRRPVRPRSCAPWWPASCGRNSRVSERLT